MGSISIQSFNNIQKSYLGKVFCYQFNTAVEYLKPWGYVWEEGCPGLC